jgi:hypothetical protein
MGMTIGKPSRWVQKVEAVELPGIAHRTDLPLGLDALLVMRLLQSLYHSLCTLQVLIALWRPTVAQLTALELRHLAKAIVKTLSVLALSSAAPLALSTLNMCVPLFQSWECVPGPYEPILRGHESRFLCQLQR